MQEMLLGLIRGDEHRALLGERSISSGPDAEKALEGMDAGAGAPPLFIALPSELGPHRFSHAPAMGEAKLGEHDAAGRQAEVVDEVSSQEPHRHCVNEERTLPGEANDAPLRVQLEQLLVV